MKEWRGVSSSSKVHTLWNRPLVGLLYRVLLCRQPEGQSPQGSGAVMLLAELQSEVLGATFLHMACQVGVLGAVVLCWER